MTERKPPGVSFESWVEKQISEATRRGDYENLPGAGQPLPGAGVADPDDWWVRSFVRREAPDVDALLPPSMLLRKQIDRLPETVRRLRTEQEVRALVDQLNAQVRQSWRTETGPRPIRPVNVDRVVREWYADRPSTDDNVAGPPSPVTGRQRRLGWWRRLLRVPPRR